MRLSSDRKMFGGFVGGMAMTFSNFAVSFIQIRILLRHFPVERAGVWIVFLNIGAYILSLDMGLSPTLGREISFVSGTPNITPAERAYRIGTLIRTCTIVVMLLAGVVFCAGAGGVWLYLRTIVPGTVSSEAHPAWIIFIAGAALNLVGEGWFAGIYGLGQVLAERMVRTIGLLLGLVYMALAVYLHTGMRGLAIAYVAQGATTVLMARYALFRFGTGVIAKGFFDFATVRRLTMPSLKYAATLLGAILILQTDNLVIASTLGAARVPDYQAGAKLITALMSLSMMLVVTSQPFISRAHAQKDAGEIRRLLNRNLRYTLSVMVIFGSFIACFADRVILLWLGPDHFVGFGVIWILLTVMLLESHHVAMATATMAAGKIVFFIPALLAGVLNLIFSIGLARHYGVIGIAAGTMFAQMLTNNWYVPWYTLRLFDLRFKHHLDGVIIPIIGFIAVMICAGTGVRLLTRMWPTIFSLAAGSVCAAGVGLLYFVLIMVTSAERRQLGNILAAVVKRKPTVPSFMDQAL